MDNIGILEAAHHMNDGVYLTIIGKELVPQALPLDAPFTVQLYPRFNHRRRNFL